MWKVCSKCKGTGVIDDTECGEVQACKWLEQLVVRVDKLEKQFIVLESRLSELEKKNL